MKTNFLLFSCLLLLSSFSFGQLSDDSTIAIEQYFNGEYSSAGIQGVLNSNGSEQFSSEVTIVQSGQDNTVFIRSLQPGDQQEVLQNGDKNSYEYYNYYNRDNSSLQVNQDGALNSVQVYGENSLMKDAIINQKSDFNTIIVRNYSN